MSKDEATELYRVYRTLGLILNFIHAPAGVATLEKAVMKDFYRVLKSSGHLEELPERTEGEWPESNEEKWRALL